MKLKKGCNIEKRLRITLIMSIVVFILGILINYGAGKIDGLSEMQSEYMKGFGVGFIAAGIALGIKSGISLSNPKSKRKAEIEETDERLKDIHTRAMAITFRLSITIEALVSAGYAIANYEIGTTLGLIVGAQLICFLIADFIISRKM